MALHQYIGARYVPKFYENSAGTAEWRSGVIYEPLTIVTWNGNSYTSKKLVPATVGNPSDNPSFWVATGLYNQQVEDLRQQVIAYKDDVDDLENRFTDVENVSPGEECYIFISDSYGGAFGNPSGDDTTIWEILGDLLNMPGRVFYATYTASGFVPNVGDPFLTRLQGDAATIAAMFDPARVTKVVVAAGRNDYIGNEASVFAAMETFDQYVKTTYPNATRYYGYIANGNDTAAGGKAAQILNSYRPYRRCIEFGGVYLNGVENAIHINGGLSSDGIHPSIVGKRYIARAIYEAIKTGYYNASFGPLSLTINPDTGYSFTAAPEINMLVENNGLYLFTEQVQGEISIPSTNFSANNNAIFALGTIDVSSGYINAPFGTILIPITLLIDGDYFPATIRISAANRANVVFRPNRALNGITSIKFTGVYSENVWPLVYC